MSENVKKITLRAFSISNLNIKASESDIMQNIITKLNNTIALDRILQLRSEDSSPIDLLSDYVINNDRYIFGVMLRLVPTKEVNNVPDTLLTHSTIQMNEITKGENKTGLVCSEHFYFALNNSHLVTNLPRQKTIKGLQTYINWLTESLRGDVFYELCPMISTEKVKLSNLSKIVVSDPNAKRKKNVQTGEASNKVIKLAKDLIGDFFDSVPNIDNIIDKNILSARLILSFTKPKEMTEDDYKRELSAYLKPVSDNENIEFSTPKGNIKGHDLLLTRNVDIDILENGALNEKTILSEMTNYLIDLKHT